MYAVPTKIVRDERDFLISSLLACGVSASIVDIIQERFTKILQSEVFYAETRND